MKITRCKMKILLMISLLR